MGCVLSHYLERVELITHKGKERKEFCRDSFIQDTFNKNRRVHLYKSPKGMNVFFRFSRPRDRSIK